MSHKSITLAKPVCNDIQRKKDSIFSLEGKKSFTYQMYRSQKRCCERRQLSQGGSQILRVRTRDGWLREYSAGTVS